MTHKMLISLIVWTCVVLFLVGVFLAFELPAVWNKAPWYTASTTLTFVIRKTGPVGAAVFTILFAGLWALGIEHWVNPETFDKRRQKKVRKARETLAKHGELPPSA